MKLNPPPLTLLSKISSRSDFIHDSGFIPTKADLVKKDCNFVSKLQSFLCGRREIVSESAKRTRNEYLPKAKFALNFASQKNAPKRSSVPNKRGTREESLFYLVRETGIEPVR